MSGGYTQDELRQLAADHGYSVSNVQVGRWHRFGLLPEPRRQPLGKGHGSAKAVYPRGTIEQLLRLCELRRMKHERRPHYLAWYLWWEGLDVSQRRVREFLEAVAGGLDDAMAERRAESAEELRARIAVEFAGEKRLSGDAKLLSRIRRRVGKEKFPDVVSSLELSLTNDETDAQKFVEALGLQFLFGTFLSQKTLGASDAREVVDASREALSTPYGERLAALSDADLRLYREQLQAAFASVQSLGVILRQVGGASAQALVDALLPTEAASQARFLLSLGPLLEDPLYVGPEPPEGGRTVIDFAPDFEFLELLMREVRGLHDLGILTPRRLRAAAHDGAQFEHLVVAIWEFAKDSPQEFEAFLAAHPEERQRLYPADSIQELPG